MRREGYKDNSLASPRLVALLRTSAGDLAPLTERARRRGTSLALPLHGGEILREMEDGSCRIRHHWNTAP